MSIVTVVMSLAVPVNDGVRSFEGEGGRFSVTVGEAVSTSNVTGLLVPAGFPSELGWTATAVYSPFERDVPALPELQLPPVPGAAASETMVPSAFDPA